MQPNFPVLENHSGKQPEARSCTEILYRTCLCEMATWQMVYLFATLQVVSSVIRLPVGIT